MTLNIKFNTEERNKVLIAQNFYPSLYHKLDYFIDEQLVAQSRELLYEYLINFRKAIDSLKKEDSTSLHSIGGVVDIEITRDPKKFLRIKIINNEIINKKMKEEIFETKISYEELKKSYSRLLLEIKEIASEINLNLNFNELDEV